MFCCENMTPEKYIIDCDGGTDDAVALVMLIAGHKLGKIKIEAVTCVTGNTTVDNVVNNVFRTLEVCNALDIPVFKGLCTSLLDTANAKQTAKTKYHGGDGFGDVYSDLPNISKLNEEHAVNALNRIVSKDSGNVNIVCLGPLTNIAVTAKVYPDFIDKVNKFFVMGGNSTAQGNVTAQAEFNFYADPESVHIVLNRNSRPFWLLPWETCYNAHIPHEWRNNVLGKIDSPCVKLLNDIEKGAGIPTKFPYYKPCDAFLAGYILKPEIATKIVPHHADIELHGDKTRGQVVLDHLSRNTHNIHLIEKIDTSVFQAALLSCVLSLQ